MTFAIETVYVVPSSNTLPTAGTDKTEDLDSGQFGIFLPNYVAASAVTSASARYLYLDQGRPVYAPGEGTKRSDKIFAKNVITWYKMSGQETASLQITKFSDLTAGCNEDISLTLRLDSFYIRTAYFNGLTRSVMTTTPCCDCGSNPCDTLVDADIQAAMVDLATKLNADTILNKFVHANIVGTGATTAIYISALAIDEAGNPCNPNAYPYMFDRISFWTYIHKGPDQTNNYEVVDRCDSLGTLQVIQRSSYPTLQAKEVAQVEKDNYSYQAEYKHIFDNTAYNGEFSSLVETGVTYDLYYLKFVHNDDLGFGAKEQLDEAVSIYVPQGETATIEAILTAAFGIPIDESAPVLTTTTSTTTTTTSTTSTTTLIP